MKKTERIDCRLTIEEKKRLYDHCSSRKTSASQFIREAVLEKLYRSSWEYHVKQALFFNQILNANNTSPTPNQEINILIEQELYNHEKYYN